MMLAISLKDEPRLEMEDAREGCSCSLPQPSEEFPSWRRTARGPAEDNPLEAIYEGYVAEYVHIFTPRGCQRGNL